MASSGEIERLRHYSRFADALVAEVSKDDLAKCAQAIAVSLSRYWALYGDLPELDYLSLLEADTVSPETASIIADGLQHFVDVLASVSDGRPELPAQQRRAG